jgi:drug/metabolite transporter (DMT)-like permease
VRHPAWCFLTLLLPFVGGVWAPADVAWGAVAGAFGVIAIALLYACLAIGPMSILSPLTAVVSAIAPMLWGLLVNGETLSAIGYLGLGVALVAVVLVGFIPGERVVRPSARGSSWRSARASRSARSSSRSTRRAPRADSYRS